MIEALISSKTRIKLLLKFFLNSSNKAYLRGLEEEFGESTNAIRLELNKLEKAGMVSSDVQGNKKFFTANVKHPLFFDLNSIIRKYVGIDTIIENVIKQLGEVERVYLSGEFAKGRFDFASGLAGGWSVLDDTCSENQARRCTDGRVR